MVYYDRDGSNPLFPLIPQRLGRPSYLSTVLRTAIGHNQFIPGIEAMRLATISVFSDLESENCGNTSDISGEEKITDKSQQQAVIQIFAAIMTILKDDTVYLYLPAPTEEK